MSNFSCVVMGNESLLIQCAEQLLKGGDRINAVVTRNADIRAWATSRGLRVEAPGDGCRSGPIASPCISRNSASGSRPEQTTVDAPLAAARLAASTFVIMPPRPIDEPAPPAIASRAGSPARTCPRKRAAGSRRGSAVNRPG